MRVAIYCRLSEEDRNKQSDNDDSLSIQNQKSMLLEYALERKWEVYSLYIDDDYAGADRNRPEFNRLLKDAEERRFDIVLCKTQSRFTRELELVERYIHDLFPRWGIRFISIVDNADTANKGNKKSRQINGLVNEWYLEDMSESIKSVLTNRRRNGHHIGSFALYGYLKDPDVKGHLIVDEEAASVIREIFTLFSQGMGKTAIARYLNDKGIPNPTEYKRLKGMSYKQPKSRNSTLWKYSAISKMLTNEMYIGNMVQGKYGSVSYKTKENKPRPKEEWYIVHDTHEAIIDRDLWDVVQLLIAEKTKPFITGNVGIFANKVRCGDCGYTLKSSKTRNQHYLKCTNKYVANDFCNGTFISVKKLEKMVVAEINRISDEYLDVAELEYKLKLEEDLQAYKKSILADISTYNKKITEYTKGIREVYMDKVRGLITDCEFMDISKNFTTNKSRLESELSKCEEQLNALDEKINLKDNRRELITRYTDLTFLTREIVVSLIDHIVVYKRIPGTRNVPIDIHWNF